MPKSKGENRSHLDGFEVEIFKLVREGATSEQWQEWLRAPLEHAAAKGNMDLFTRLMDAGANGSAGWRGCRGRTLLGAAARGRNEKMVFELVKAGAAPDIDVVFDDYDTGRGARGVSALYTAAFWGADAVAKALLIARADPICRTLTASVHSTSPLDQGASASWTTLWLRVPTQTQRPLLVLLRSTSPHSTIGCRACLPLCSAEQTWTH